MCKTLNIFIVFIVLINFTATATNNKKIISGKILTDKNWAIEFANIALYRDSSLVTGTVSDFNGNYKFEIDEFGEYILKISHINYAPYSESININSKQLNSIVLLEVKNNLEEITIKADKPIHEKGIREDIFNISKNMLDRSGNVRELLIQIPTLYADRENNITVEGDGNVLVMVNGRRYYDTNPLDLLAPEQIKKITVSTTPAVDIVNEGFTSVVNILLKQEKKHSINGNFDYVFPNKLLNQVSGAVSLYKGKWRMFGGYKLYSQTSPYTSEQYINEKGSLDTLYKLANNTIAPRHRQQYFGGADLFLNDKNSIGVAANLKSLHRREIFNEWSHKNSDLVSNSMGQDHTDYSNLQVSGFYQNKSQDDKKQVIFEILHSRFFQDKDANFSDYSYPTNNATLRFDSTLLDRNSVNAKLKFSLELGNTAKFTFGANYYNENSDNDIQSYNSKHKVDYSIGRTTVFADYSNEKNKLSYWLGLGYEYNNRKVNEYNESNYEFYPNAGVSYSFTKKFSTTISYQKIIQHPTIYQLDPFEYINGLSEISKGNAKLSDYYSHSINLATRYRWKRSYIKADLFYCKTKDGISSVSTLSSYDNQVNSYENIASYKKIGIKLNLSLRPYEWLLFGTRTAIYHEKLEDLDYKDDIVTADILSYVSLYLPKNFVVFVHYFNHPDELIYNGKLANPESFNYGISKYFFNKRFELCANFSNQFLPYETTREYRSGNSLSKTITKRDMRTVMFSLFYNFSSKKRMEKKARNQIKWEEQGKEDMI